jgi:NTE family protein
MGGTEESALDAFGVELRGLVKAVLPPDAPRRRHRSPGRAGHEPEPLIDMRRCDASLGGEVDKGERRVAETVAMVLAGGVALGAYQAGAYAAMEEQLRDRVGWIAGSSIGAVNGAIIAGNAPGHRVDAIERFWEEAGRAAAGTPAPMFAAERWTKAFSWLNVAQTRALGRAGLFAPNPIPAILRGDVLGLYRLEPLGAVIARFVDFDRLNGGDIRISVLATDLGTREPVVFDTGAGDRIEAEHLMASCGFLPDFAPREVGGRLLGDGAFIANAPVELVLADRSGDDDLILFVIDLFARDTGRPASLTDAAELRRDLLLAGQTHRTLEGLRREDDLRRRLARAIDLLPPDARDDPAVAELEGASPRGATTGNPPQLSLGSGGSRAGESVRLLPLQPRAPEARGRRGHGPGDGSPAERG